MKRALLNRDLYNMEEPFFIYDNLSEERNKLLQEAIDVLKKPKKNYDVHTVILKRFIFALFKVAYGPKEERLERVKIVESKIPLPEDLEFLIPKLKNR